MEIIFEEEFFIKFRKIVKLQNILLLSIIAKDNGWDLKDLKKKYLKERIKKSPIEKEEIKLSVKNKKKVVKKSPNTEAFIQKELNTKNNIENISETTNINHNLEGVEQNTNINGNNIKCKKYSFMDNIYYVSLKNYVYDKERNFVGTMEDNEINFDGEESEDNI